jgi:glyoxylase-like metal-dependent hydrolase (beta-lactamase superfamily II)
VLNLSSGFGFRLVSPPADVTLNDGDTYQAAGLELKVLAVPGHSAGHVVYLCQGGERPLAFVGDVIFAGSVGRTDFPDGDFDQLARGIREKLFTLPEETLLYSGHGSPTTVGRERRHNPYVGI